MSDDRLGHDIENKNSVLPAQPNAPRYLPLSPHGEVVYLLAADNCLTPKTR